MSTRNTLIAVTFLAFIVYLRALFFSVCRFVMYVLLRNITSVPCKIDGGVAPFQYVSLLAVYYSFLRLRKAFDLSIS